MTPFAIVVTMLRWFSALATAQQPKRIPLGTLFSSVVNDWKESLTAFRFQVEKHNSQSATGFQLEMYERLIDISDNYQLIRAECSVVSNGVFGLIGMTAPESLNSVDSFTRAICMPYVTSGAPDYFRHAESSRQQREEELDGKGQEEMEKKEEREGKEEGYTLFLRPSYYHALVELMQSLGWTNFYYIYDWQSGLIGLKHSMSVYDNGDRQVELLSAVHLSDPFNCYKALRHLDSESPAVKEKHVVLDMSTKELLQAVLSQILHLGMHKTGYHYILGGLAMNELELSMFRFGGVHLTGFRLVEPGTNLYNSTQLLWSQSQDEDQLTLNAALTMDAVHVFVQGLSSVVNDHPDMIRRSLHKGHVYNGEKRGIQCRTTSDTWIHGPIIADHLRKVNFSGLTGPIAFGRDGMRKDFRLQIVSVGSDQPLHQIGTWTESSGVLIYRNAGNFEGTRRGHMTTMVVTSVLEAPYLMVRREGFEDGRPVVGNDRFHGLCADLAKRIAETVQLDSIIRVVADGNYGVKLANGTWNGMIGELMRNPDDPGMAEMAIAPLTISSARERVVDFTKPFMNLGISIMIKKPDKQKPGIFSFMDPLSIDVWACIVFSYLGVSLCLFLVGRISPYEGQMEEEEQQQEQQDAGEETGEEDGSSSSSSMLIASTDFSLLNSLWFSLGALLQQGCGISPRSMSGRLAGCSWWFFTLILISSYTANLAAFLTVENLLTPINSADDLVKQSEILYGTRANGSTIEFFETSNVLVYRRMWTAMHQSTDSTIFPPTTEAGVTKVRSSKGKYAFLLESTMNDYHNQKKPCNTMKVGENLDSKGYGVATRLGHPLREDIELAVLELLESGEMAKLQKKWWIDKGECPSESESKGGSTQSALTLSNVAGIFYILIGGLGLAMSVSFAEFLSDSLLASRQRKRQSSEVTGSHCMKTVEPRDKVRLSHREQTTEL